MKYIMTWMIILVIVFTIMIGIAMHLHLRRDKETDVSLYITMNVFLVGTITYMLMLEIRILLNYLN